VRGDVAGFFFGGERQERQVRSGWLFVGPLPPRVSYSTAVLRLRVIDGRGQAHVLWAGSIEGLFLAATRLEARHLQDGLRHAEAVLAEERARSAVEKEALQARIAAMKASRFWKLRNAWFRLKARVGMSEPSEVDS